MKFVMPILLSIFMVASLLASTQVCLGQQTRERQQSIEQETNTLVSYYAADDQHYKNVSARLFTNDETNIQRGLEDLQARVAQSTPPEQVARCDEAIKLALIRTRNADPSRESSGPPYESVNDLLSDDPTFFGLTNVIVSCNALPVATQLASLKSVKEDLQGEFALIDLGRALRRAKSAALHTVPEGSCQNVKLDEGYLVSSSRIENPFHFIPWVQTKMDNAGKAIRDLVDNKPFSYSVAVGEAFSRIEKEDFMPQTSDARMGIRIEVVAAENCSNKHVDLVYRVYSTQILPVLSAAPESRVTEKESPQTATGQTNVKIEKIPPARGETQPSSKPLRFIPLGGYDSVNKLSGGSRFEVNSKHLLGLPLDQIVIQGQGSSQMKSTSGSVKGAFDSQGWLAHSEWLANYSYFSRPTGTGHLKSGNLSAQFSAISKPLAGGNLTMRFGGLLEGGNQQSRLAAGLVAPKTVTSAGVASLKLYAGLDSRISHNILSASYGLQLGSLRPGTRVDWRKQIGDVRHEFWYPLGDHRILDLESRLTLGSIQIPGRIPVSERFFGGNNEELFIPNDTWEIRQNPVIRAIPGSSFFRTSQGAGGTRFISYNLTAAYSIWRKVLIPTEITNDDDFKSSLKDSIDVVTNTIQNYYTTKDKGFADTVALLPKLKTALADLQTVVQSAPPTGPFEADFKKCVSAIKIASSRANEAVQASGDFDLGSVNALLSVSTEVDEDRLTKVIATATKLAQDLGNPPALTAKINDVDQIRNAMETDFGRIDIPKAKAEAKADMAFTRRTLNTMFKEVNLYAISPVFVFDIAKMSPQSTAFGGTRSGPGLGVRFEIATMAHFTAGYAWNRKRGPGEAPGTVFFSIGVRDLFH